MPRYIYVSLTALAISSAIHGPALAQTMAACTESLRYAGISWDTKSDNEKIDSAVRFFCSSRFESSSQAQSALTKAGFVVEAIPMSFGGDFSNEQFQQRQEQFCENAQRFAYSHSLETAVVRKLDDNVAKAVGDCIRSQSNGLFAWLEQTVDPKAFKVHLALRGAKVPAKITDFAVLPSSIRCTTTLNGALNELSRETLCTRDPGQAVTVSLNATNYTLTWVGDSSLPPAPKWDCTTLYLRQPYTTASDTRVSKSLSCPAGMAVLPASGKCLRTSEAHGTLKRSEQIGDNTWVCQWDPQPEGVGLWVEMGCHQCK